MTSPALRIVDDGVIAVDYGTQTLIDEGEYSAAFLHHETVVLRMFGNSARVFLHFRIVDPGEAFGKELYRPYRVKSLTLPRPDIR
jgi:hypothetical protein